MSVVEIEEQARITILKKFGLKKSRAVIIPAGSFFVTMPLKKGAQKEDEKWLFSNIELRELENLVEESTNFLVIYFIFYKCIQLPRVLEMADLLFFHSRYRRIVSSAAKRITADAIMLMVPSINPKGG